LTGNEGDDVLAGGPGSDALRGDLDVPFAPGGEDRLAGGPGVDFLVGGQEQDILAGGKGADVCDQDFDGSGADPFPC
jgi:Ca2+-binding RTX toxin-like protein